MVSRHHCVVRTREGLWVLEDAGSSNGTLVNGAEVQKKRLSSGDIIRVGETVLSFNTEDSDPLVGVILAGCRIEKRLGRGGSGTVYRATHLSLERPVAVKILAPSLANDGSEQRRHLGGRGLGEEVESVQVGAACPEVGRVPGEGTDQTERAGGAVPPAALSQHPPDPLQLAATVRRRERGRAQQGGVLHVVGQGGMGLRGPGSIERVDHGARLPSPRPY